MAAEKMISGNIDPATNNPRRTGKLIFESMNDETPAPTPRPAHYRLKGNQSATSLKSTDLIG
jgi:hypothetical protein